MNVLYRILYMTCTLAIGHLGIIHCINCQNSKQGSPPFFSFIASFNEHLMTWERSVWSNKSTSAITITKLPKLLFYNLDSYILFHFHETQQAQKSKYIYMQQVFQLAVGINNENPAVTRCTRYLRQPSDLKET